MFIHKYAYMQKLKKYLTLKIYRNNSDLRERIEKKNIRERNIRKHRKKHRGMTITR